MAVARLLAPVAAPPPPKPPQLNIVASALMPDVATDTYGPGQGPRLASAGWTRRPVDGRRAWDKPPGDEAYRALVEQRNALVAAIETMSDVEMKQAEEDLGLTPTSLPESVFPATADSRWTGGFAYAPENQWPAQLADPCGQLVDLPGLPAPTGLSATPSNTGGTLTAAGSPYTYEVTAVGQNGETVPGGSQAATIASGTTGSVALTWTRVRGATSYRVYGRVSGSLGLLTTVTGTSYTDTGAASVGAAPPVSNTTGGPGAYGNLPIVNFVPYLIQVEDECSAFGFSERDFVGRALRLLDNATPNAIERELWSGAFSQNTLTGPVGSVIAGGSNAFFTETASTAAGGMGVAAADLTPGTVPSVTRGIQILEDYLANTGFGGQGMLHVAPETSPNLLGARRLGALLLSVMDNIIVPGTGYPTSGPTGPIGNANATPPAGQAWMFATDLISVRLDAPMVYPTTMAEALDRATNTIRFRAQRYAAATWDMNRLAAVRVNLAT